jgi:hypothetical protein
LRCVWPPPDSDPIGENALARRKSHYVETPQASLSARDEGMGWVGNATNIE